MLDYWLTMAYNYSMSREYRVYGRENIEEGALTQMNNIMSLPVVTKDAFDIYS